MVMKFIPLPWKPELVFTGLSIMEVNPETNKFCSHLVCMVAMSFFQNLLWYGLLITSRCCAGLVGFYQEQ